VRQQVRLGPHPKELILRNHVQFFWLTLVPAILVFAWT
jgi:hypothetical protein